VETKVIGTTLTQTKVAGLRDAATGEMLCELGINSPHRAAFSPDGKLVASVDGDGFLRLWEVVTGKQVCKEMKWAGTSLVFSPNGKRIASGTIKGEVLFVDVPPEKDKWAKKAKEADRDKLWGQLAGEDPVAAYEAIWTLAATPKETLALLKARLKRPSPATDVKQIQKLIDELDSDRFAIREAAMAKLRKLGGEAELPLREALDSGKLSLEARRRVQRLVALLKLPFPWKGESLREVRALHLLEMLDTPEATTFLKSLAEGPRTSALVQDAKRILERQVARKGKGRPLP
jgi:hypothetical protein